MYFKEKLEHTDATNKFVSDQEFRHSIFGYGIIFFFLLLFVLNDIGINMSLFFTWARIGYYPLPLFGCGPFYMKTWSVHLYSDRY